MLEPFFGAVGGGSRYILGLNFRLASSYTYVVNETQLILQTLGKPKYLQAVEIGNECDIYAEAPEYYRSSANWKPAMLVYLFFFFFFFVNVDGEKEREIEKEMENGNKIEIEKLTVTL